MKLYYWKSPYGNFGDDLNPWLWGELIPDVLDEDESTAFIGIGTLLNSKLRTFLPKASRLVVFGSGVGYGERNFANLPSLDKIYCLRGPLSAHVLDVPRELALTDPALLVRRFFKPTGHKVYKFAFMPHHDQTVSGGKAWKSVCEQLGFGYIDPVWSREKVLSAISQTEILLAEAMHGAIIADALRVPWIPISTVPEILSFKWWDWCLSLKLEYQPKKLIGLRNLGIKRIPLAGLHWLEKNQAAAQLAHIAKKSRPNLSDENRLEQLTNELEERLQQFKDDIATGYFHELVT